MLIWWLEKTPVSRATKLPRPSNTSKSNEPGQSNRTQPPAGLGKTRTSIGSIIGGTSPLLPADDVLNVISIVRVCFRHKAIFASKSRSFSNEFSYRQRNRPAHDAAARRWWARVLANRTMCSTAINRSISIFSSSVSIPSLFFSSSSSRRCCASLEAWN